MEFINFISSNALQLILMLIGFGLLVLEIYLPGFGVAGISGTVLILAGIIFAADSVLQALIMGLVVAVLLGVAFTIAMRAGAKGKMLNKRLILNAVATKPIKENPLEYYIGREGNAVTPLNPVGSCEIEGARISVLSDDGFIEAGAKVQVQRVEGKQLYVKRA